MKDIAQPFYEAALCEALIDAIRDKRDGYCLRADHQSVATAEAVVGRIRASQGPGAAYLLVNERGELRPDQVSAERAIELRNRKGPPFVLLVPSGIRDSTASSLRNAFAAFDLDSFLMRAIADTCSRLDEATREYVEEALKAIRLPGVGAEERAFYCFAVASSAEGLETAATEIYRLGMIPDSLPAATVTDDDLRRLAKNAETARKIVRPARSHSSIAERLDSVGVQPGPWRQALETFLGRRSLSDWRAWMSEIADDAEGRVRFSRWDLLDRSRSQLRRIRVLPCLDASGTVESWSKLKQGSPGTQPFATNGDKSEVKAKWESDPKSPVDLSRWLIELVPSQDFYAADEWPDVTLPSKRVKGSVRTAALRLDGVELPDELASLAVQFRLTPLGENGQELEDSEGRPLVAWGEEFQLRPVSIADAEATDDTTKAPAGTVRDLGLGRVRTALEREKPQLDEVSYQWSGTSESVFVLTTASGDRLRVAMSPLLKQLESESLERPECWGQWRAEAVYGRRADAKDFRLTAPTTPLSAAGAAFLSARRTLFAALAKRDQRRWVAIADWDPQLESLAGDYVERYFEWLSASAGEELLCALSVDVGTIAIRVDGRTVEAGLVGPHNPLRLSWFLDYRRYVDEVAARLVERGGMPKEKREALDLDLLEAIDPIGCPPLSIGPDGELRLGAGSAGFLWSVTLPLSAPDPSRSLAIVHAALGDADDPVEERTLDRLAVQLRTYLELHPYASNLRIATDNAGDGRFAAQVVRALYAANEAEETEGPAEDATPRRLEVVAHFRPPLPARLPELDAVRNELEQRGGSERASPLRPLLDVAIRSSDQLSQIPGGGAHLSLLMDVTTLEVGTEPEDPQRSLAGVRGLFFPLAGLSERPPWRYSAPAIAEDAYATGERMLRHQRALARWMDERSGRSSSESTESRLPVLSVQVAGDEERLAAIHRQSDWVVTLDRFIEPSWLESDFGGRYLLDHSPDVSDSLSRRLLVTTGHRTEAKRLLGETLRELGLDDAEGAVTRVLDRLRQVSGRLALRTMASGASRRESAALAVAVDRLADEGHLSECALIPVDSHRELFSPGRRRGRPGKSMRCDLIIASRTTTGLKMRLLEVKGRAHRPGPEVFSQIVEQLEATEAVVRTLWCDPSRPDADLQAFRLARLLEHHLRRAVAYGSVRDSGAWHSTLRRLSQALLPIEIEQLGIVVCPAPEEEGQFRRSDALIRIFGESMQPRAATLSPPVNETRPSAAFAGVLTSPASGTMDAPSVTEAPRPEKPIDRDVREAVSTEPVKSTDEEFPSSSERLAEKKFPAPVSVAESRSDEVDVFGGLFGDLPSAATRLTSRAPVGGATLPADEPPRDRRIAEGSTNASRPSDDSLLDDEIETSESRNESAPLLAASEPGFYAAETDEPIAPFEHVRDERKSSRLPERGVDVVLGDADDGPVHWRPSTKGSPHLFVIGIPGQGKSVTTTRLLCELAVGGIPAVTLDFHGEFADPSGPLMQVSRPLVMDAAAGLPFSLLEPNLGAGPRGLEAIWELAEICQYVCGLGDIQRDALFRAFQKAYEGTVVGQTPALRTAVEALEADESDGNARNVIARCRPLFEFGLFADAPSESFTDRLLQGAVLDLSRLKSETLQLAAGAFALRKLYRQMFVWKPSEKLRLAVVLDEAHRLAKDVTLPKLMKEGRKFGVLAIVASQDVNDFHEQVLSNAGTKVIFRMNYPDSRKAAGFVRSDRSDRLVREIERLGVGEAYVQTPEMGSAKAVRMRRFGN